MCSKQNALENNISDYDLVGVSLRKNSAEQNTIICTGIHGDGPTQNAIVCGNLADKQSFPETLASAVHPTFPNDKGKTGL